MSTSNCFKGYGAGVQTMPVGVSLGGGKIDENCRALETAKFAPNRVTFCKIYVELKDAKKAGVTLDDCMDSEAQVALDPPTPVIPAVAPAPAPAPAREIVVIHDILPDRLEALPQVIQAPVASHKKRHNKSPVCPDRPTGEK